MPRRTVPDALALAIGNRIKQLRVEAGLTMEKLAYESEVGSKGHLSSIEKGLVRPTAHTLAALAERLGVRLADLVSFPEDSDREQIFELTRQMPQNRIRRLLRAAEEETSRPVLRAADETSRYNRRR